MVSIILALLFFGPSVCAPSAEAPFEEEEEEAHVLAFCLIIIIIVLSFGNAPSGGITKPGLANEAVKYVRALMTIAQRNIVCSDADGNGTDDDFSEDVFEFPSVNKRCNVTKCNAHHTTRALVTSCFWWDDDPASRAFFRASHSGPSEHFKTTSRKTDAMTNCCLFSLSKTNRELSTIKK